VNIFFAKKNKK